MLDVEIILEFHIKLYYGKSKKKHMKQSTLNTLNGF